MSPLRQTPISFTSGAFSLEGVVTQPVDPAGDLPGILLCHPEPHLGGTMASPVIEALVRGLTERGFLTLRFNYRGIGESEGESGLGAGELEDAKAALKILRSWPGVDRKRIAIVGYSFGAGIVVRLALREKKAVRASVAVSPSLILPPLGIQDVKGMGSLERPMLVLIGEEDGLTPPAQLQEWVEGLDNPSVRIMIAPEANRSWEGKRNNMTDRIARFLDESLDLGGREAK